MTKPPAKIVPCLWYTDRAEEAARFYVSLFPDSRIDRVTTVPAETPAGPPGSVVIVAFTLFGDQAFTAMAAGPLDPFNHAVSFQVLCDDQAEVDRYWQALCPDGMPEQCGWVRDRYGLAWQIVPRVLNDMTASPDRAAARRAIEAMLTMVKLDVAALQKAFDGR